MQQAVHDIDDRVTRALDSVGIVGQRLRERLTKDLKAKIVLRAGRDAVEVIGESGTGKHKVVEAAHAIACDILGRTGPLAAFDCGSASSRGDLDGALVTAIRGAQGGTLVLDRFGLLEGDARSLATRLIRDRGEDAIILAVSHREPSPSSSEPRPATSIRLRPLHEREEDVWELIDHFFEAMAHDDELEGCLGFSRQAKGDIAQVVQETCLKSVRRLRDIVRDLLFETLADGELPLKLTSEHVRPYLERTFGQTSEDRAARDAALVASQFEAVVERSMLERLAGVHEVSGDLLQRQAQIISEIVEGIDDVPRSYRNIMTKVEDVQRAAAWLVTGAKTQAAFRQFFGSEGFMRPTKSVAWAFYNRVFKRDM